MRGLPRSIALLIVGTTLIGSGLLVWALFTARGNWHHLLGLLLAGVVDFFQVELRKYKSNDRASITMDIVAIFVMLGLFGPEWAMFTALVNGVVFGFVARVGYYKVAYNVATVIIATWASALIMTNTQIPLLVAAPLGAAIYCLINTAFISVVLAGVSNRSPLAIWRENYSWMFPQQIALAVAGFILGTLVLAHGWTALLVAMPLPMLIYTYRLYAQANHRHTQELEELSSELINTLAAVVDARDAYTFGHSTQVARYSVAVAEKMGYSEDNLQRLYRSALLHDIGKIGIPEQILFKPERLTPEEYEIMKRHTTIGYDIINRIRALREAAIVALRHHERVDGKGYPHGLARDAVDLDSRIVCVADTLETMLSDRPYRRGCTLDVALAEVDRCSGTQFDPDVIAALHKVVAERGTSFFVNSAQSVHQHVGANLLQWFPDVADGTAAGKH